MFSKEINVLCKVCRGMINAWTKAYVSIFLQYEVMLTKYSTHFVFMYIPPPPKNKMRKKRQDKHDPMEEWQKPRHVL